MNSTSITAFKAGRQLFYIKTDAPTLRRPDAVRVRGRHGDFWIRTSTPDSSVALEVETEVTNVAKRHGVLVPSCTWTLGRQWTANAAGQPLTVASVDHRLKAYADLAATLQLVHSIPGSGAGYVVSARPITGAFDSWPEYLLSRLDAHLHYAWGNDLLASGVCAKISEILGAFCSLDSTRLQPMRLLHGDLNDRNVFAENGQITALLDWEDALVGDPAFDLAFWATFHPAEEWPALFAYCHGFTIDRAFWNYYLRIAVSKLVLLHKQGHRDLARARQRIEIGLKHSDSTDS